MLPPSSEILYVMSYNEREDFGWLNQQIRRIGYAISSLSPEEAQIFASRLSNYGIDFETTPKGILITIRNIEALLNNLAQELEAARMRAVAA